MNEIVTILIVIVALGILVEALRRLRQSRNNKSRSSSSLPNVERFDEAAPSQTGIFRVREILGSKEQESRHRRSTGELAQDAENIEPDSLPDPFDSNKK